MTYSIIAHDSKSGEMGIAIQSYYYGCAPRTVAAEPGVGVIAMQMIPEAMYGREGLKGLAEGVPPEVVLGDLIAADPRGGLRQVAMLDNAGRVAAYTGNACIPVSGHCTVDGASVQGAMVEDATVWLDTMEAFTSSTGPLADRLLAAMRAGERAGGDIRGKRTAALVIVSSRESPLWVMSRPINIRVDDNSEPLDEVERHLALQRHMGAVELAFDKGLGGDVAGAVDDFRALAASSPDDPDVTMRYGVMLAMAGDLESARVQLARMERVHSGWKKVTRRLVEAGLLPNDPRLFDRSALQ